MLTGYAVTEWVVDLRASLVSKDAAYCMEPSYLGTYSVTDKYAT